MAEKPQRRLERPALFICDIQTAFEDAIWQFDKVILTTQKMLQASTLLSIPTFITTQNASRLGAIYPSLPISSHPPHLLPLQPSIIDKTKFSMWILPLTSFFSSSTPSTIVILGIETHICVTQTALDAKEAGHRVYVLVDGVSSCNREEREIALERLRAEGVIVTSSESWLFEFLGDAGDEDFKKVVGLVKEWKGRTREVLGALCGGGAGDGGRGGSKI